MSLASTSVREICYAGGKAYRQTCCGVIAAYEPMLGGDAPQRSSAMGCRSTVVCVRVPVSRPLFDGG